MKDKNTLKTPHRYVCVVGRLIEFPQSVQLTRNGLVVEQCGFGDNGKMMSEPRGW